MMRRPLVCALLSLSGVAPAAAQDMVDDPAPVPAPVPPPVPAAAVMIALPAFVPPVPVIDLDPPRLPLAVRAMIDEAMRGGDTAAVAAVVKIAIATQPHHADEIRAVHRAYLDRVAHALAERTRADADRIRNSGVLDLWTGQVELGAYRSTGNTSNFGFTGALKLDRKGIDWQHTVELRADYENDAGSVSREQYRASYQPRYRLNDGVFTYGRVQFEKDEIQGFRDRYSLSGGLGYRVVTRPKMTLALQLGPALRRTLFLAEPARTEWSALTSLDFDWKITDTLRFTQNASGYAGSDNNTFTTLTGIEAGMAKGLKAKLSYSFEHETAPPQGALRTDTISRFSLVYGF